MKSASRKYLVGMYASVIASLCPAAFAATDRVIAMSGSQKAVLVELYSSESCSSCPPADQWMASLAASADLWTKFVPVAFHVDYWNHLDWTDAFSSNTMTARQVSVSKTWKHPSVYTPAVVVSGAEWRGWRQSSIESIFSKAVAQIDLKIVQNTTNEFTVIVNRAQPTKKYIVHFAKLGMAIDSRIARGENSGKKLQHNFIVLDWQHQALDASKQKATFATSSTKTAKKYAVIAWIEEKDQPIALQTTGAYL